MYPKIRLISTKYLVLAKNKLNSAVILRAWHDVTMYGKPFVPPVKGNVKGNGEVNCNGKQLTNGKRNDSVNG